MSSNSNPPGKNRPNQNQVGIPTGTNRPRPNQGSGSGGSTPPPSQPNRLASQYDPKESLATPSRSSRLNRTERIREVAQGGTESSSSSSSSGPARRSSAGQRAGAVSKRAQGVATPSFATRAARERAARERTNRQIRLLLVVGGIVLVGVILLVAFLGNNNNSTNNVAQLPVADQTQTAVAAAVNATPPLATATAFAVASEPTVAYPGGPAPTAAAVLTSSITPTPGPIAINVDKGIADKTMTIVTNRGTIVAELYSNAAPNTVKNYQERANRGEYNGRIWHRIETWVIQGNDPTGSGSGGGDIPTELNKIPFTAGSLGIARTNVVSYSNDSQFFIDKTTPPEGGTDFSFLNGQFDASGNPTGGYTNFGHVVSGQDIVDKMQKGDIIYTIKITDGAPAAQPTATPATSPASGTITGTGTLTGTGAVTGTGATTRAATPTAASAIATPTTASVASTPTAVSAAATPTK